MKKLLTTLTLLFTLCSFAIGQNDYYFGEPIGPDLNMTVASIIYIDGEIQTNQTIEIAAYIDGELRGVCKSFNVYDFAPAPFNEYHYREFIVLGYISDNGKKVTFKGYNHDTQEELIIHNDSDELIYEAQTAILVTAPLKLYFTSANPVAKVGDTEYSNIDDAIANWTANTTLTLLDNVTLSDVITLKSTEHHILDLSTYTMTAASGKNAIEIVAHGTGDAERSAITINADAATPGGINAGSKSVIYYNYTNGGITTNDRPIIKINNGVFYGATSAFGNAGIYFKGGSAARQAATLEITGGVFNCSIIGQSKSKLRISGGIFNYSVGSQGDSTALRLIWGGTFKSFGFMTADDNNTKFWFGTSMANSNVGLYINDDDYLVVGGAVITEAGEMFEASSANYSAWSYLLQYSSVATNGLYYTDALTCLKDNDKTTGSVNVYADQLDLTSLNYKGTINISKNLVVTFTEGTTSAWTVASTDGDVAYNDVTDNGIVTRTYTVITPVAQIGETLYMTLAAAVEAATAGQTITLLKDAEGSGVVINKNVTIDFAGFAYTLNEGEVISIQEGGVATFVNDANITEGVELFGGQLYTTKENLTVVAKKTINGVDNGEGSVIGWNTISTPIVGGVTINEPAEEEGIHDLYRYNEETMTWEYYKNTFSTLDLGHGYLYSNVADIDLAWEGVLNIKDVTVSLSYTDANSLAGFNMVGNPFAYNITKDNFKTTSAILADGYYEIGYDGSWIATTNGGSIAPMSSVLVKTDKAEDITIAAKARSVAKRNESKSYLAINVANANHSDVAYVSFDEGLGLDKINHRNADIPMISVPVEGKEYAIAKMNQDVTEIPVTFKASAMGEYTISARSIACKFSQITLIDKQTGNTTNMLLEDYSFIATSNDDASRFVLKLDNGQQPTGDSHFAYVNDGEIIVSGIEGNAVVRVMDVTGRLVTECSATESVNIPTASFRSGVYMIQMMDNNGVKVQKVIID